MKSDRELLELAAKAATIKPQDGGPVVVYKSGVWLCDNDEGTQYWNPLTDDGDAFRLLVNRRLTVKDFAPHDNPEIAQAPADAALWGMVEIWREDDNDPLHVEWYKAGADRYAATRRAIVRAAAEIGDQQ